MDKLLENVKKELKQIETDGLNTKNIDVAYKLASIGKNVTKMEKEEGEKHMRDHYMDGGYDARRSYRGEDHYNDYGPRGGNYTAHIEGEYGRRGMAEPMRTKYRGPECDRFDRHLDHIEDGVDMYVYGRQRYFDSGEKHRMHEGLEKLMYGICMFVETAMDFAETPEEKEIIRKHIQKIKSI